MSPRHAATFGGKCWLDQKQVMNPNQLLLETMSRSPTFQNFQHAFTETTGLPLTLRTVETWQLPFHSKTNENVFCALTSEQSPTCAACLQLQEKLGRAAMHKTVTRTCAFGLCETAVPVKLGSQTIGFLQTGQVMRQKPTAKSFRRAVRHAQKLGVDISNEPTKRAYFATPVVSQKKLNAAAGLLAILADHLAIKSNQLLVQTANAESPLITKAKEYIQAHYAEELSLRQVSSAVNSSLFYFCKQFRKATGLSFTEFVSRTRIEKAKNLLLNPNLRVSEIAFNVGFQSLTHFNRVFKKIVVQSPTAYRNRLSAS